MYGIEEKSQCVGASTNLFPSFFLFFSHISKLLAYSQIYRFLWQLPPTHLLQFSYTPLTSSFPSPSPYILNPNENHRSHMWRSSPFTILYSYRNLKAPFNPFHHHIYGCSLYTSHPAIFFLIFSI